eukprot:Polyplicarium_translucidae@DN2401_c0_g1_i4.p1
MPQSREVWMAAAGRVARLLTDGTLTIEELSRMRPQEALVRGSRLPRDRVEPLLRMDLGPAMDRVFREWVATCQEALQSDRGVREAHRAAAGRAAVFSPSAADGKASPTANSVDLLRSVNVNELCLGRNAGVRLEGVLVEEPQLAGGVFSVLEDPSGRCVPIEFYSCLPQQRKSLAAWRFESGTRIAVKEPHFAVTREGRVAVRVRFTSDLVFEDDVSLTLHQRCGTRGNELFQRGFVTEAAALYTKGIEAASRSAGQLGPLLCNRAQCHLQVEAFDQALADCETALALEDLPDGLRQKARYRMGRALVGLWRFADAFPVLKEWPKELLAAKALARQALRGEYDWPALLPYVCELMEHKGVFVSKEPLKRHHVAEYCNPTIEVAVVAGKGRGLFAKRAIAKGSLVAVTKAIAVECTDETSRCLEFRRDGTSSAAHVGLRRQIIRAASANPSLLSSVYALYDGTPSSMAGPLPKMVNGRPHKRGERKPPVLNFERIDAAIFNNAFGLPDAEREAAREAVFLLPSLLNHSPRPNCVRWHTGDLMVIKACRAIAAGDELTISYAVNADLDTRLAVVEKHGDAEVEERAQAVKDDPKCELRRKLRLLRTKCDDGQANPRRCVRILSSGKLHPHPELGTYYHRLGCQLSNAGDEAASRYWGTQALHATLKGDPLSLHVIEVYRNSLLDDEKAAEMCTMLYGEGTWPKVEECLAASDPS